jgi:hypothetical protein
MSIIFTEAAEQERIRCIYAAMPGRTDEQLEEILANQDAEFHVRAAAADVQRDRARS